MDLQDLISRLALALGIGLLIGLERGCERDGGRIGTAAAERGDLVVVRHALESGDDDDLAFVEGIAKPGVVDMHDPRAAVATVRYRLRATGVTDRTDLRLQLAG